ncbi:hypothetical protein GQ56_0103235 [Burkholderia paludis]|nr:hypothetical protein GQ56_0103235 [Burkholderia paludis]
MRAFLVASFACLNLAHSASAAYTEAWMSDSDVKEYARQVRHPAAAAGSSSVAKQARPVAARAASQGAARAGAKPAVQAQPAVDRSRGRPLHDARRADPKRKAVAGTASRAASKQ